MSWYVYGLIASVLLGLCNFLYGLFNKNLHVSSILVGISIGLILVGLFIEALAKKNPFALTQGW